MELGQDKIVRKIIARLQKARDRKDTLKIEGTWGSFGRLLVSYISNTTRRPVLYVCPHIDDADKALDDFNTFSIGNTAWIELLSAWEGEEDLADATDEIRAERLRLVSRSGKRKLYYFRFDTGSLPASSGS